MPVYFCFKNGIWWTLGIRTSVAWNAASDVVFSWTLLVIVVGKIIKAPLHRRKLSTGLKWSGKLGRKYQNLIRSEGVRESPGFFLKARRRGKSEKIHEHILY